MYKMITSSSGNDDYSLGFVQNITSPEQKLTKDKTVNDKTLKSKKINKGSFLCF